MTLRERSPGFWLGTAICALLACGLVVLLLSFVRGNDSDQYSGAREDGPCLLLCVSWDREGGRHLTVMRADGSLRKAIPGSQGCGGGVWDAAGRSIAYVTGERLHLYRLASPAPVAVDTDGKLVGSFSWFPDSRRIAFCWGRRHATKYYIATNGLSVVDTETRTVEDLVVTESVITAPALSPDGRRIAFGDDTRALAVIDLAKHRMTRELVALDGRHRVGGISWSPDGRFVAFVPHGIFFDLLPSSIWVYDTLERSAERLFEGSREWDAGSLVWHPSASELAFTWTEGGFENLKETHLCIARPTGSTWSVSEALAVDGLLTLGGWSDDGQSFAYSIARGGCSHIYVCAADLSQPRAISPPDAWDYGPAWQPERQLSGVR